MPKKSIVYICQDGDDGMEVYVGRTRGPLQSRLNGHHAVDGNYYKQAVATIATDSNHDRELEAKTIQEFREAGYETTNCYRGRGQSIRK